MTDPHDLRVADIVDDTGLWHRGYAGRCDTHDWWGDVHDRGETCLRDLERHVRETKEEATA